MPRMLVSTSALAVAVSIALLAACASDETAPITAPDATNTIPAPDSGADGSGDADLEDPGEPCTPDALCPNGLFDPSTPGGPLDLLTRISVIRGRSARDVWAAGAMGAVGHFDGSSWTTSDTASVESLEGLWLRDSGEVAVASLLSAYTRGLESVGGGTNPSAGGWSRQELSVPDHAFTQARRLTAAWTTPDAEWLWCTALANPADPGGVVNGLWRLRVDPSARKIEVGAAAPPGACEILGCAQMTSVHGSSSNDLWAVGLTGAAIHITDAQSAAPKLTAFDSQTWAALYGVWAASASEAWAVGGGGVMRHFAGAPNSWDIVEGVPTTETLNAVWGSSGSDIWAVGDNAVVLHYDGTAWSRVKVGGLDHRHPNLYTVWTSAPGHVWIGGNGVVLSLGGKT